MMAKAIPDRIAVMSLDPGGTTGVAWGAMDVRDTLAATLQAAELGSADITGEYQQQATKLADMWTTLSYEWTVEQGISADNIHLVSEGFTLRKFGSSNKQGLYPVWILAMLEGLLWESGVRIRQQGPDTKTRSTSARMKRWGCWEVGVSEHRKDAMRHLAFRVNNLI